MYGLPFALIAGGCVGFTTDSLGQLPDRFTRWPSLRVRIQPRQSHGSRQITQRNVNIGGLLLFILGGKVIWATGFACWWGSSSARAWVQDWC